MVPHASEHQRTPTPPSNLVKLKVTINKNGHPKQVFIAQSVMEIPDEENECIQGIAFYTNDTHGRFTWRDFNANDFDRITIDKHRE